MNNLKKSIPSLLTLAVCSGALLVSGCKKDEKGTEQEQITKVVVHLTGANGSVFNQEFEAEDPEGDGVWNTIAILSIPANTVFDAHIHVYDGADEIDGEIEAEGADHLFTYAVTGANLTVSDLNPDSNGDPLGIESTWMSGLTSSGQVRIRLHHEPTDKIAADPGGEIDFEVTFPVQVQ